MKVIALMLMVKIGLLVWSGLASADNSMELSAEANLDSSNSSTTLENQVFCVSSFNILPVLSVGLTLWFGLASGGNTMNMTERNRPFSKVGKNWTHFFCFVVFTITCCFKSGLGQIKIFNSFQ